MAAIERGELSVEDPREVRLREAKEVRLAPRVHVKHVHAPLLYLAQAEKKARLQAAKK